MSESFLKNKAASLQPAQIINKRPRQSYFPVNFAKFLRAALQSPSRRILLIFLSELFVTASDFVFIFGFALFENGNIDLFCRTFQSKRYNICCRSNIVLLIFLFKEIYYIPISLCFNNGF